MQTLRFTPWHGMPYERFNIMVQLPEGKRRIGRMLAPNQELALVKSRELFPDRDVWVEKRKDKPKNKPKGKPKNTTKKKSKKNPKRRRLKKLAPQG